MNRVFKVTGAIAVVTGVAFVVGVAILALAAMAEEEEERRKYELAGIDSISSWY